MRLTFRACARGVGMTFGQEVTVGGLCYRCAYSHELAPGIWQDGEGPVHFDTPENREEAITLLHQVIAREVPGKLIEIRRRAPPRN